MSQQRVYVVCMARLNVWVPDELAARARERGLNVSALAQAALQRELSRHATDHWLDHLSPPARGDGVPTRAPVSHSSVLAALEDARGEFDGAGPVPAPHTDETGETGG